MLKYKIPQIVTLTRDDYQNPIQQSAGYVSQEQHMGSVMFRLRLLALYDGTFTGICRYYGCHSIHPVRYRATAER